MKDRGGLLLVAGVAILALAFVAVLLLLPRGEEPAASPTLVPSASAPASASVTPSPTFNAALLGKRLTVLVIGTDVNATRAAAGETPNTDSLILTSVSADQSQVAMVSVPRDTVDIPLPDGGTWDRKVNGIEEVRGVDTLVGAISELTGVPIDGYVQIDMDDLVRLVDAVGGVDVEVEEPLRDPKVHLDIAAGKHHLDGATALSYVRTRVDTDFGRARRQQEVVLALVAKLVDRKTDLDVGALLHGLSSLKTDLPLDDLPTLLEIGRRAQSAGVTREVLSPPRFIAFAGDRGDGRGYVLEPNLKAIRSYLQSVMGGDG